MNAPETPKSLSPEEVMAQRRAENAKETEDAKKMAIEQIQRDHANEKPLINTVQDSIKDKLKEKFGGVASTDEEIKSEDVPL